MEILFEDKYIVVVFKPYGIPSQPDKSGQKDMTAILKEACKCEIFVVHRLDTATEGVMVYAKDSKTAGQLSTLLAGEESEKIYIAALCGEKEIKAEDTLCDLLWHDKRINKAFVVDKKRAGVKEAKLEYKTIAKNEELTLVKVKLHTGRTHQIRAQFAHRQRPLAGDGKYGSRFKGQLALRCVYFKFPHPKNGKILEFMHLPKEAWNGFHIKEI